MAARKKEQQEHPIVALVNKGKSSMVEGLSGSPVSIEKFIVGLKAACAVPPSKPGQATVMDCVVQNPDSVMQRLVEAAQLGLSPAPVRQHFHLIPRNIKGNLTCTSIIGYRGLIDLAMRSGDVEDIGAEVVYKDELDDNVPFVDRQTGDVNHNPDPFRDVDPKKFYGAYAWAKLKGRTRLVTRCMGIEEVKKRRAVAQTDAIWTEWPKEMVIKTVLRALLTSGFIHLGEKIELMAEHEAAQEEEIRLAEYEETRDQLVSDAAEATDHFTEDELEEHDPNEKQEKAAEEFNEAAQRPARHEEHEIGEETGKPKKKAPSRRKGTDKKKPVDAGPMKDPTVLAGEWQPDPSLFAQGSYFINTRTYQTVHLGQKGWTSGPQERLYEESHALAMNLLRAAIGTAGLSGNQQLSAIRGALKDDKWNGDVNKLTPEQLCAVKWVVEQAELVE